MNEHIINIRQAEKRDSRTIAKVVAMAIGDENAMRQYCGDEYITLLTEIAENENSQYSYHNTLIAEIDDKPIGAIIGYDGAKLHELRTRTYSIIQNALGRTPSIPDETEAGEFYLDSIAVFPKYQGNGIGRKLITAMQEKAFNEGHKRIGLIVDFDNPKAEKLYTSLGFSRVGTKIFLEHKMWHLQSTRP